MRALKSLQEAEEFVFSQLGRRVCLATPVGIGKPNQLLNRIYLRAKKDSSIDLTVFIARRKLPTS